MDNYFKVISDKIRSDSQLIAEYFRTHPGENGRNKETILLNFLKTYLPRRYSTGTGFIASSEPVLSNQNDIVIYDSFWSSTLFPELASQIFLIESVYAIIEVKSHLDETQLKSTINKAEKIKLMQVKGIKRMDNKGIEQPCFCLFAYDSTDLPKLKLALQENYKNTPLNQRIDFIVVLNKGMIYSGIYYEIVKYGQSDSPYRKQLDEDGLKKLQEANPSEIEGMYLDKNTLYVFYMYLMTYLGFSASKIANWVDYLPSENQLGTFF